MARRVFEALALAPFGNRLPQLAVEAFRPMVEPGSRDGLRRTITPIPATGALA